MSAPGWPATLSDGQVTLRPLRMRDGPSWMEARRRNIEWLRPWEATPPRGPSMFGVSAAVFTSMTRRLRSDARAGRALPFVITYRGEFAGQLNVAGVVRGSMDSAHIGYWVDEKFAGRGVMPTAVALAVDHCLGPVGLHRIEVNIRPENTASRRVVEKLGFREEGLRERYLHISGDWRDHLTFALVRDDIPHGLLHRWRRQQSQGEHPVSRHRDTPA
ncbi:MAG: GNAT family N-acetyltransferase [Frankiaceae bacterium]|nr:GNAT family N-acetyltransferase [Frankiaceae bacterium]MBV9869336.1 GNAT family N-acetyltransferase [Frankiaceae bacterium]